MTEQADQSYPPSTLMLTSKAADVRMAADMLHHARLIAFPTETVYGLGADATQAEAVAKLFAAKGRPHFNPLIAHCASLDAASKEGVLNADALMLAKHFWPGPLTLVVPVAASARSCDLARAGLSSIGLRVPDHPVALALLRACDVPIVAPSANRSGHISPTRAEHVWDDLHDRIDAILDGGPTSVGVESTIIACLENTPVLLRAGAITRAQIEQCLGHSISAADSLGDHDAPLAPGMLSSHYAPRTYIRLDARGVYTDEAVLDFGNQFPDALMRLDLSPRGDVVEAASHLYDYMRALDVKGAKMIAVAPIPHEGLGEAINDRLLRAAAPR